MRVTVLGVVLALTVLPAFGQASGNPDEPVPVAVNHTHPMIFQGVRPDGTVESLNWSGYAVTGSSFTVAKGSWVVPSVD